MSRENPMKSYRRYKGRSSVTAGKKLLRVLLALILVGVLVFCSLLGVVLAGSRDRLISEPEVLIVLGCQVMPSGAPSVLLKDRLDKALGYWEEHPDVLMIVTGGKGGDEKISEAEAMANYLRANGVPESNILVEDRASSTWENLLFSGELLSKLGLEDSEIAIVSNGFHLTRAKMLWNRLWGNEEGVSVLAAPCSHFSGMIWMHVREPLVLAKDFLLRR